MRLLIADDEVELANALSAILKHSNYTVDAVYNGTDALDYALTGEYDGIILDVMPSLSTLTFDSTTKTVNFVCTISQIELYDQDRNKTIRELNPEMTLTFTSTQKTKAGESGD